VKIKTLYTCCEQVGRRGKDCETIVSELFCYIETTDSWNKLVVIFFSDLQIPMP
jgi:hypothetical protein